MNVYNAAIDTLQPRLSYEADDLDNRIIDLLRADPTIQNSQISNEIGVSNATTGTRIKKLREFGMLRVVASTDIRAAGFNVLTMVIVELSSSKPDTSARVARQLAKFPQIIAIGAMLHQDQLIFNLLGRDTADIEKSLSEISRSIVEITNIHVEFYLSFLKTSPDSTVQPVPVDGDLLDSLICTHLRRRNLKLCRPPLVQKPGSFQGQQATGIGPDAQVGGFDAPYDA